MEVKKEMTGRQAYQKLAALCARSEHCQQEMLDKMRQWGVDKEEQAQVMERLIKERYVDDERLPVLSSTTRYATANGGAARWNRHCG